MPARRSDRMWRRCYGYLRCAQYRGGRPQSFALQNISGNIANASTIGFKGIDTTFEDLVAQAAGPTSQVAGGVQAFSQQTLTTAGTVTASSVATNMAINGDGFFSVMVPTSIVDNQPVFNGVTDYTRAGDFQVNANGNLVNGAGYYLMGVTVDPKTGNPEGSVPTILQFDNNFVPAEATSALQYAANLPTTPATTASTTAVAGSITAAGGLNASDFATNPLIIGSAAPPINATITGAAVDDQSGTTPATPITTSTALSGTAPSDSLAAGFKAGDSIVVDGTTISFVASGATGSELNVTDNIGALLNKISDITGSTATVSASGQITLGTGTNQNLSITGGTTNATAALTGLGFAGGTVSQAMGTGTNTGKGVVTANDLTAFTNESISGGAVTAFNSAGTPVNLQLRWALTSTAGGQSTWNLFGTNFTFNSDGALISPSGSGIAIPNVQVNGQSLGNVALNFSSGALTSFASTTGSATVNNFTQNGFAAGQLQSVAINDNGLVVGTFSNGQNLDLAQVTLSHFNGTNYLQALSGEAYAVTEQSGPAIAGASGTISGSALEGSNTDIADEFTKLIVTQQAYSANTKVITTANDMVQDLLNVLR